MQEQNKNSIILAITNDVKLYECFVDNLNFLGFKVYLICNKSFKYKNLKDRLFNFYKKTIDKDRGYKRELARKYNAVENLKQLTSFPNTNYSLTIRADLFDKKTIQTITTKSKYNYAYQWDGLSRFPEVKNLISLFKKFYIFDEDDLKEKNTFPTTNFYFDCYNALFDGITPEYDAYFIGAYDKRIEKLLEICEYLHAHNKKLNIILFGKPKSELKKYSYIKFIKKPLSYTENLKMLANSKIIIDLSHQNLHKGLSFRAFEALGYNKKMITTNSIIQDYDFYNATNICVFGNNNKPIEDFISSEYQPIDPMIKQKYSFTNWIAYTLEKDNSMKITFPKNQ
ncbi:hypothetical protein [Flavobacterium psychrophilum]|uniref:hypothetical protein n=1 Tax=Flavobacterium psychrophilum TaxID=96345 RepID=UPI001D090C08|nr:hypothetical protein [Flavobacterium psychrophilum]EKT3956849.1 hypothetical protein [Flavobacterium psychrophilum]EKT4508448.1 hypothetical protein [Flavobacterium psychrophilum]MCB6088587.1 hypothetical protein [Flavobacterium psychrophilum]